MKRIQVAIAGLAALSIGAVCGTAGAADMAVKAPLRPAAPAWSWSGCYVGGYVGGAGGRDVNATEPVSLGGAFPAGTFYNAPLGAPYSAGLGSSVIGGGSLGCNWQWNSPLVVGIEGDIGAMRLRSSVVDPNSIPTLGGDTTSTARLGDWYGVIAGRIGYGFGRTLIYAKGGAAFSTVHGTWVDNCTTGGCGAGTLNASGSTNVTGGAFGGGLEYAFDRHWSVKAEYLFLALDRTLNVCGPGGATAAGSTFCGTEKFNGVHTGVVGLNYHFDWAGPMVARR